MTANQKISLALLIGRVITVGIYLIVIKKQYNFLYTKKYPELFKLRIGLLVGTFIVILGNVVPVLIDTAGLFGKGSFNLLLIYVFSNNITALLSACIVLYNLRLTQKIKINDDIAKDIAINRLKKSEANNAALRSEQLK